MATNAVVQACHELERNIATLANADPKLRSREPFKTRYESRRSKYFRGDGKANRGRVVIVDRHLRRVAAVEPIYIRRNVQ